MLHYCTESRYCLRQLQYYSENSDSVEKHKGKLLIMINYVKAESCLARNKGKGKIYSRF